jgi:hypothetical protein
MTQSDQYAKSMGFVVSTIVEDNGSDPRLSVFRINSGPIQFHLLAGSMV